MQRGCSLISSPFLFSSRCRRPTCDIALFANIRQHARLLRVFSLARRRVRRRRRRLLGPFPDVWMRLKGKEKPRIRGGGGGGGVFAALTINHAGPKCVRNIHFGRRNE